jgi:hypothetical protein
MDDQTVGDRAAGERTIAVFAPLYTTSATVVSMR